MAREAGRFLNLAITEIAKTDGNIQQTYDEELKALHTSIGRMASVLLSDNANCVKQCLIEGSGTELAVFFDKLKGNN